VLRTAIAVASTAVAALDAPMAPDTTRPHAAGADGMAWVYVGASLLLAVYGQLVVKWQVLGAGRLPASINGKVGFFSGLLLNPWMLSAMLTTFIAALCWMAAMTHLELSKAYPFAALSFVLVLVLSSVFFGEALTPAKAVGVGLVMVGLIVGVAA
jgi:drug/metabolite transporter (DMT)-like permease